MRSKNWEAHVVRAFPGESHMGMSKEPFCIDIYRKNAGPNSGAHVLYWNLQEKTHMGISEPFCVGFYKKNAGPLFRGWQCVWMFFVKKRTWRCHKSHFVWKFTGKIPHTIPPTSIEHRAFLTLTVRTPSVWPHCLGNNSHQSNFHAQAVAFREMSS